MTAENKEITVPLNDIRHLFVDPDCDPFQDRNLTISGLEYIIRQLRMKPLPEKVSLNLSLAGATTSISEADVKKTFRRHCLSIVKEREEDFCYINWQIGKNFKRALLPFLLLTIAIGLIMYNMTEDRSRIVQIILILLNNCVIIMGWVLMWIPAEKYLYEAPRVKREIALYKVLADADINLNPMPLG